MNKILERLYLGDLNDAQNYLRLKQNVRITIAA